MIIMIVIMSVVVIVVVVAVAMVLDVDGVIPNTSSFVLCRVCVSRNDWLAHPSVGAPTLACVCVSLASCFHVIMTTRNGRRKNQIFS